MPRRVRATLADASLQFRTKFRGVWVRLRRVAKEIYVSRITATFRDEDRSGANIKQRTERRSDRMEKEIWQRL